LVEIPHLAVTKGRGKNSPPPPLLREKRKSVFDDFTLNDHIDKKKRKFDLFYIKGRKIG
jgi:hypothetical protein